MLKLSHFCFHIRPLNFLRGLFLFTLLFFNPSFAQDDEFAMDEKEIQNLENMLGDIRKNNAELVDKIEKKFKRGETLSPADMLEMAEGLNVKGVAGGAKGAKGATTFEAKARVSLAPFAAMGKTKIKQEAKSLLNQFPMGKAFVYVFGIEKTSDFFSVFLTHKKAPYKLASLLDNVDTLKLFAIINIVIFFVYIIMRFIKRRRNGGPVPFWSRFRLYLFVMAIRFGVFYVMIYPYLDETWWIAQRTLF